MSTVVSTVAPAQVDARMVRFTAVVTASVLVAVLILASFGSAAAAVLLALQAVAFGIGAVWGPEKHPYAVAYRKLIAPRVGPVTGRDYVEQVRFAQLIGFIVCAVGVVGFVFGAAKVGVFAAGFGLFAAMMRAVFGVCLSRGPYMMVAKLHGKVPVCCQNK